MSLQFEDQNNMLLRRNIYNTPRYGFVTSFLLRHNIIKDEKRINAIMILISITLLVVSIGIFGINIIRANTKPTVKYNISKDIFNKLPESYQIKFLGQ